MPVIKPGDKKEFETCPPYRGNAVCVDVTAPKVMHSKFGDKMVIRFVFEVLTTRKDGSRFAVWSSGFGQSLHEKANLRKFLKGWRGHDLSAAEEAAGFDTDSMIGKDAYIHVENTTNEKGQTFANVTTCAPIEAGSTPVHPSGKFVREKDRKDNTGYGRTEGKATEESDVMDVKVHVGKSIGQMFKTLPPEAVLKLRDNWKTEVVKKDKLSADDKRLLAALDAWEAKHAEVNDQIPMDY